MPYIKKGFAFTQGQNFARAWDDLPFEIDASADHPRCVVGWIGGRKDSPLAFLRGERIRVMVDKRCIGED